MKFDLVVPQVQFISPGSGTDSAVNHIQHGWQLVYAKKTRTRLTRSSSTVRHSIQCKDIAWCGAGSPQSCFPCVARSHVLPHMFSSSCGHPWHRRIFPPHPLVVASTSPSNVQVTPYSTMHPSPLGTVARLISLAAAVKSHLTSLSYLILVSLSDKLYPLQSRHFPSLPTRPYYGHTVAYRVRKDCPQRSYQLELLQKSFATDCSISHDSLVSR